MAWEFKPGMKVVCVDAHSPTLPVPSNPLVEGQVYTISWVGLYDAWDKITALSNGVGVRIEGITRIHSNGKDIPFGAGRFRPLQTQFTSLLNSIVAGVNDGKVVVEDDKYMKNYRRKKQNV